MWIVSILYWIQLFLCPTLIIGLVVSLVTKEISIPGIGIGAVTGVIAAEYVRRRIGLSTFFAGIYGSGEIVRKLDETKKEKEASNSQ